MSDEHPLPWAVVELSDEEYGIVDANGILVSGIESVIKCCRGFDAGRAAHCLIVRAVNSHEDLVAACKAARNAMGMHGPCTNNDCKDCQRTWDKLDAALAKVEGKS